MISSLNGWSAKWPLAPSRVNSVLLNDASAATVSRIRASMRSRSSGEKGRSTEKS